MRGGNIILDNKLRLSLTIDSINYSENFEDNWGLFSEGINILRNHDPDNDFNDDEREVLDEIFSIIIY